jgi:DNA polymerase I-like protein with 3'-5' exonuclease and polymerase domains
MLRCYESGDPYLEFAVLAGAAPVGATKESHPQIRKLYKVVTLAVGYGMRWWGLQHTAGVSEQVARRVDADFRRVFATYCEWREKQVDEFAWRGRLTTLLGWPLHKSPESRENTVINFGVQGNAAEMLRLAAIEARFRGVEICALIHDALLIQAPIRGILRAIEKTKEAMTVASRTILGGYTLRVDCGDDKLVSGEVVRGDITRYPQRFYSEDGLDFWNRIRKL